MNLTPRLFQLWRISWLVIISGYSLVFLGGILTIVVGLNSPRGEPFPVPFWLWLTLLVSVIGMISGTALIILTATLQAFTNSALPFFPHSLQDFFSYPRPIPPVSEPPLPAVSSLPPRPEEVERYTSASGSSRGFWSAILVIVIIFLFYR